MAIVCVEAEPLQKLLAHSARAAALMSEGLRFPKIRGTLLGFPIIRIIVYWVYIGVPLFWET